MLLNKTGKSKFYDYAKFNFNGIQIVSANVCLIAMNYEETPWTKFY